MTPRNGLEINGFAWGFFTPICGVFKPNPKIGVYIPIIRIPIIRNPYGDYNSSYDWARDPTL